MRQNIVDESCSSPFPPVPQTVDDLVADIETDDIPGIIAGIVTGVDTFFLIFAVSCIMSWACRDKTQRRLPPNSDKTRFCAYS